MSTTLAKTSNTSNSTNVTNTSNSTNVTNTSNTPMLTPLKPIDIKISKKNKRKERLMMLRKEKHVSVVQAVWRGFLFRKKLNSLAAVTQHVISEIREQKLNNPSHRIIDYGKIDVKAISTIQCCIDYGLHLPFNCSSTKTTIAMYNSSRKRMSMFHNNDINFNNPSKLNELKSRSASPNYNHTLTWKLNGNEEIDPTTMFIIKIEALELPTLKPVVVGYAFLNLFINESAISPRQPKGDDKSSKLFLNGGQFELSIYYGNIPKHSSLNIELMEKDYMKKIPNAFLYVRVLDPTNKVHETNNIKCMKNVSVHLQKNIICDNMNLSTETKLVNAYLANSIVEPRMPSELKSHYTYMKDHQSRGGQVDLGDLYREQLDTWVTDVFNNCPSNWPINSSTMFPYNDEKGLFCALDFLYNLPMLNGPSSSSKDIKTKNVVHGFKATFSYLSGKGESENNDDNWVEDDCTTVWDFDAPEACPSYNGEMFHVSNFGLTEGACILIVVTAINIITDDSKPEPSQKNDIQKSKPAGVKGLEIFYLDPTATWYGLLKVKKDYFDGTNNFFVYGGTHQVPLIRGIPPDTIISAKNPYQVYMNMIEKRTKFQKLKYEELKKKSTCCFDGAVLPDVDDDPSVPQMISKDGASAFIRIADGRLKNFHDKHIFKDTNIILKQSNLQSFVASTSCDKDGKNTDTKHRRIIEELFNYDALKHDDTRRLKDAIPIHTDRNELIRYINEEYRKHVENS